MRPSPHPRRPGRRPVRVGITSTPANGTHYVAGEAISTRLTMRGYTLALDLPMRRETPARLGL